ncbi:MAG: type I-C CRISPR-associated protein Cas8c/Csd1 [Actinomycetota bacterium]|jgi:CRISPR-associated protein Csd1|nr:type I-C CRISPR-associated protein Cas8c/Csd1 [Actinomycetota bacterium]
MILQRLAEYAARMEAKGGFPPPMYGGMPIRWVIPLTIEGKPRGEPIPLGGDTKATKRGHVRVVPQVGRTSGVKANLLADNGEYVLGVSKEGSKKEKARQRHEAFAELVRECARSTEEPTVEAIAAFLDEWEPEHADEWISEGFDPADNVTFEVAGTIPAVELESVQKFWAGSTLSDDSPHLTCLVTGESGPVERRLPVKVKGLTQVGGQSSGTSLVSANASAFQSYGLENSLTSPISRDAAERFGKSLNHLLAERDSHIYIGGTLAYVWWAKEGGGTSLRIVSEPDDDPESVYRLMDSARTGTARHGSEAEKFFCLALSASGGRAVVRDWLETTIPEVEVNLGRWFRGQNIVDAYGDDMAPFGVFRLAAAAYRDVMKEMQPSIPAAMVRVALNGGRLPEDLLARAVRRCVVGTNFPNSETTEHVTRERAALIKLIFTTQGRLKMEDMKTLEPTPSLEGADMAAYSCGRLLAELEQIQREALGRGINTTLVDRYYGAASTTPGKVFGLLIANSQDHLSKIRKSRGGTYEALQRKLEEIMAPLTRYPNSLDVGQQGLFALGYYHQRAENRAAARAAKEAKDEAKKQNDGEEN